MLEWRDHGLLLSVRPHGESAAIIEVLTERHGRHMGVVRGGQSRRIRPVLQPGASLDLTWGARLDDHLGHFVAEPVATRSALLADRRALAGLNAVCALLHVALPERDPHPGLYGETLGLFNALDRGDDWSAAYALWELTLLEDLGFGLDLASCALTGASGDLAYVSPRTGRAVSRDAAGDWAPRLLPLPGLLTGRPPAPGDMAAALALTGHFLARSLEPVLNGRPLPEARQRLVDLIGRGV